MSGKLLLMGRAAAGKTSIRSIIFANYVPRETNKLHPTTNVENCSLRLLGSLALSLWDCGGQDQFMENYFETQKEHIFRNVQTLIYVLGSHHKEDAIAGEIKADPDELARDISYFKAAAESITSLSPNAQIFVFIHKMDLVPDEKREQTFNHYKQIIMEFAREKSLRGLHLYATSIWDETLFKAWSSIVYSLIPNAASLERHLSHFRKTTETDEVVLFEKNTFVVICHSSDRWDKEEEASKLGSGEVASEESKIFSVCVPPKSMYSQDILSDATESKSSDICADVHRFEKISNLIKQFKLSVSKCGTGVRSMQVSNMQFTAILDRFTENTFVMVVQSNNNWNQGMLMANIRNARNHFNSLANRVGAKL